MRHMGRPPLTRVESDAVLRRYEHHWRRHGFGLLAAEDRRTGALVARTGVAYHRCWPPDPEVGWSVDPVHWGRGLATEAGRASVAWAFGGLGLTRVVSITVEANLASRRVMEKLGFGLHARACDPRFRGELWIHALDRDATALTLETPCLGTGP